MSLNFTYDAEGRLLTATQGARTQSHTYGADGLIASTTMSGGGIVLTRSMTRDALGRVTTDTLPTDATLGTRATTFTYDSAGNVQTLTAPGSNPNTFSYDALNRFASFQAAGPGAGMWTYTYNADGQLAQFATPLPNNRMIERTYDPTSGFLLGLTSYSGSSLGNYSVDLWGRRTTENYNGLLRTQTFVGKFLTAKQFYQNLSPYAGQALTYDHHEALASTTWTFGSRSLNVSYTRDADDLVTAAQVAGSTLAVARGPRGEVTGQTGATITESRTFDSYGAVAAVAYANTSGGANRFTEALTFDGVGRVATRTESGLNTASIAYTYDGAGHLSSETRGGSTKTYTYDANGNRLSDGAATLTYSAGKDDQLVTRTAGGVTTNYAYDGEGRLLSKTVGSTTTASYTHHNLGPLSQVTLGGTTVTYTIDARGNRAARTAGASTTRYVYGDGIHPTAELDASFNVTRVFLYTSHRHVPDYVAVPGTGSTWTLQRVITDHLGSVVALLDASGNALFTRSYDAWGNMTVLSGTTASDAFVFGFAGGLWDPTTKLVQFGARTYDPEIGRWLERDPSLHAGGVNLYEYNGGDPVNFIDAEGTTPTTLDKWSVAQCVVSPLACVLSPPDFDSNPVPGGLDPGDSDSDESSDESANTCAGDENAPTNKRKLKRLVLCYSACTLGEVGGRAFCSALKDKVKKATCHNAMKQTGQECRNWCYWHYGK